MWKCLKIVMVFLMKNKIRKKSLFISTVNLLGQEEFNQSLSFFVEIFLLDIPKDLLKLFYQSFPNEKTLRII